MASQLVSITGQRKLRPNYVAGVEARMGDLSRIQSQKFAKQMHNEEMALEEKRLSWEKKRADKELKLKNRQAEIGLGQELLGFGFNIASNGGPTLGNITSTIGGLFKGKSPISNISGGNLRDAAGTIGGGVTAPTGGKSGFFGNLNVGNILGSGLAGFGASRFVKGKGNRFLLGAGASGLMSLFSGGSQFSLGNILGGSLIGGLSSLLG